DGGHDDRGGRADGWARRDAVEDRRLLRRRGGRGRERPALPDGAHHDRGAGRDRRRHGGRDVPPDLRHGQRGTVRRADGATGGRVDGSRSPPSACPPVAPSACPPVPPVPPPPPCLFVRPLWRAAATISPGRPTQV